MKSSNVLAEAIAFAARKHENQKRSNGNPYIYHPLMVAELVKDAGYDETYQTVAVLHDTLEDTDATEMEIAEFGHDVLDAVKLLTRIPGMDETVYVKNISENHIAAVVKNADKIHNLFESVHPFAPGTKRKDEDIAFAKRYLEKATNYYEGKFSAALDRAIGLVETELTFSSTHVADLDAKWFDTSNNSMKLYSDVKAEREKKEEESFREMYGKYSLPDFANQKIRYCKYKEKYFLCFIDDLSLGNHTWKLTKAGWVPADINIVDIWEDCWEYSREEITKFILKMTNEGYFYDFVEKNL